MSIFKNQSNAFFAQPTIRKYWLAGGLIFAILGQGLIKEHQPFPYFKSLATALDRWNEILYLSLINPFNIIIGLLLIALGMIVYSRAFISPDKSQDIRERFIAPIDWRSWKNSLPWVSANLGIYALVMTQLARHQYSNMLFWGWLGTLLFFTILFWKNEHKPHAAISRIDVIWMIGLFAFGIAAGSYLLNDLPAGWIADEGPFWKMARSIALGKEKPPFFDVGIFTFPIASSYLQAWIMRWVGINFWGWRFASALPAVATVIPLYLLARELFDRRAAIAAGVMMTVNPYFLSFARLGYNNSQSLFPVTLCIYFLAIGFRKNNRFYLWLAGLTAGLGFYTYFSAWLGLVVIFIIPIGFGIISRGKFRENLMPVIIIIAGMLAVFLPRVFYGMSGNSAIALHYKIWETGPINTFYGKLVFGDERIVQTKVFMVDEVEVFYDPQLYGILLLRGFVRTSAVLFDPIGYIEHPIIFGLSGIGSSLFFILGLGVSLANFRKFQYFTPAIWFLSGFFFLGVLASIPPRPTHMVAIIPALSFISAIGLVSFLDAFTNHRVQKFAFSGLLAAIAVMGLFQFFFMIPYIYSPPNQDDYVSWLGRQIPTPANFILVDHYSTIRNPMDESLIKLTRHRVATLTLEGLEKNPDQVKTWKNFAAFISPQNSREYAERLADKIPGSSAQAGYAAGKRLRGYVVTDMPINASMDISLSHGIKDLWNSPARIILLFCGISIFALFLNPKKSNIE